MTTTPIDAKFCPFCPHAYHSTAKCSLCKCKGKRGFWGNLGEALGEVIFGGIGRG